jgi:DNA modification methylase
MKSLKWMTIQKRISDLLPQEINPRKISDTQMSELTKSLQKFNLVEIPAIDYDGTILAGHQRIKALQLLKRGDEMIDVRIPNRKLTEKESKEYLIGSNKLGGDWDFELLKDFEFDLLLDSGFEEVELTSFWDTEIPKEVQDDDFDEQELITLSTQSRTQLGDIIHLGKHRILCGDSTNPDNLKRLLGNERASMIYSDPVYNINIDYNGGIGGQKDYGGSVNDTRGYEEYLNFINQALRASLAVSHEDTHVFYWCDQVYIGLIQELYRKNSVDNKRVVLWIKNNQNPVPTVAFNKVYEPCVYGVRGKPYLNSSIMNVHEVMNQEAGTGNDLLEDINDIWVSKRLPAQEYEHATSKPITLHEKAIKRCTKPNDIIIDSFLGSGSTLLCAEQLNRRVYGCELEPAFCDLIIKRYEKMTGDTAIIYHEKDA